MPHQPHCSKTMFPNRQAICHSRFQLIQWINLINNCTTVGLKTIARGGMNTKNLNEIASQFVNVSIFQILQVSIFLMQSSRRAPHVFFKISAYIILSLANLHWQQCSWNMGKSHEQWPIDLVISCKLGILLPVCNGVISHQMDPCEPISILECQQAFERCSHDSLHGVYCVYFNCRVKGLPVKSKSYLDPGLGFFRSIVSSSHMHAITLEVKDPWKNSPWNCSV